MAIFLEGGLKNIGFKIPKILNPQNKIVRSLKELAEFNMDPVQLMNAFKDNKMCAIEKPKSDEEKVYDPNTFLSTHAGNCIETSIFYRGYSNLYNLESTICLFKPTIKYEENVGIGHMFPIFKHPKHDKWFIWNYFAPGFGAINGPFDNKEELIKAASQCYAVLFNDSYYYQPFKSQTHVVSEVYCTYLLEEDLKKYIDKMISDDKPVDRFILLKRIQLNVDFVKYVIKRQSVIYKNKRKKPTDTIIFDPMTHKPTTSNLASSKSINSPQIICNNNYAECLDMFKKMGK